MPGKAVCYLLKVARHQPERPCEPLILLSWMYAADAQIIFSLSLIPYQDNKFQFPAI